VNADAGYEVEFSSRTGWKKQRAARKAALC